MEIELNKYKWHKNGIEGCFQFVCSLTRGKTLQLLSAYLNLSGNYSEVIFKKNKAEQS